MKGTFERAEWIWGATLVVAAAVMAALPLFGLLGFESSFVLAIAVSLASAHLAARRVRKWRAQMTLLTSGAPVTKIALDEAPIAGTAKLFARALGRNCLLLLLPLAILVGNALRIKNCNLEAGFEWYLMLPVLSMVTATAAGLVAGLAVGRGSGLLAIGLVIASVVVGVARFYFAPPVFGFDPFVGWFPGSLYDEELAISQAFLIARAVHLLGVLAALATCAALLDGKTLRLRLSAARHRARAVALAAVLLVAFSIAWRAALPLLAPTRSSIAEALGGRRETAHLVLLYSPAGPWAKDLDLHAADAEFRYAQLVSTLGVTPPEKITCFLFDSADAKQRFLGASHTQIAKPWRREIYLQYESFPHSVIQHELAHIFGGEFGDSLFHVSRRGIFFNVGLVEGLAVAADQRPDRLDLDQEVKTMRLAHIEPPLAQVFGLGFFGAAPARAYTTAGSFVRFLLEEKGAEKVRAIYREGGSAEGWRAVYGQSFEELGAAWSRRVDAAAVDEREQEMAKERTRRPSVFHKKCAHELALRRQKARELSSRNDHAHAVEWLERVCLDEPDDPGPLVEILREWESAGEPVRAATVADRILRHPKSSEAQRAVALLFLGDRVLVERAAITAAAPAGVTLLESRARRFYEEALALHLDEDTARQYRIRLLALDALSSRPELGRALVAYLVPVEHPRDGALDLWRADRIVSAAPESGIGYYLVGRLLYGHARYAESESSLEQALQLGLPADGFALAAQRLVGQAAVRAAVGEKSDDSMRRAIAHFEELARKFGAQPAVAREAKDWLARCRWLQEHPSAPSAEAEIHAAPLLAPPGN